MGHGMEGLKDKCAIVGVGETKYSRRWCLNRLDPSGERRAAFGEACEVAAVKPPISHEIIGLREDFYPPAPFRSAGPGMVWACFEVRLTLGLLGAVRHVGLYHGVGHPSRRRPR